MAAVHAHRALDAVGPLKLAKQRDGAIVVVLGAVQRLRKEWIEHLCNSYAIINSQSSANYFYM